MRSDGHPAERLRPRRSISGCAAVLLPHDEHGAVDWSSFESLLGHTVEAGLTPAVNMDTGFVQSLDPDTRIAVLDVTERVVGPGFLAGAYVPDHPGASFAARAYEIAATAIASRGGHPVIFPSHGLNALDPDAWVAAHEELGAALDRFFAFELGEQFVPYGRIYPLEAFRGLLGIRN